MEMNVLLQKIEDARVKLFTNLSYTLALRFLFILKTKKNMTSSWIFEK